MKLIIASFSFGIRNFFRNYLQLFRVNLLFFSIVLYVSYLGAVIAINLFYTRRLQEIFLVVFAFPFISYFTSGLLYYHISSSKNLAGRLAQIYRGYIWFFSYAVYFFLMFLFYQLIIKQLRYFFDYSPERRLELVLSIIVIVWFYIRSFFVPILLIVGKNNFSDAFFESWNISRKNSFTVILFSIFSLIIISAGFLFFIIGVVPAISIVIFAYINMYNSLTSNSI